jgi:hypothetical protein
LKYLIYQLAVPVVASNYKHQILLPAEFRKVCYSLAEIYVKSVCLNLFGWREEEKFMKHFKGGATYKFLEPVCIHIWNKSDLNLRYVLLLDALY